jgi:hypothetical protein
LLQEKTKNKNWEEDNLNIASRLFDFYQPLLNSRILTDPLVEKRSLAFFIKLKLFKAKVKIIGSELLAPIRENALTLGYYRNLGRILHKRSLCKQKQRTFNHVVWYKFYHIIFWNFSCF